MRDVIETALTRHRCHDKASRWGLSFARLVDALDTSLARLRCPGEPAPADVERAIASLHLDDLVLACACAEGLDAAWEHFIREYRPSLYRAADAIDPSGGARELADGLYGELFGLTERDGQRRSHFRYYHGRSSLGTWLRAVLAQRHVDRIRSRRRLDPLPEEESPAALPAQSRSEASERPRYVAAIRVAMAAAVAALTARDRLRLTCYYAQALTLAEIGRALAEHEATVSRHLTRTRRAVRAHVERYLREAQGMTSAQIDECFASVTQDAGSLHLPDMLGTGDADTAVRGDRAVSASAQEVANHTDTAAPPIMTRKEHRRGRSK